MKSFNGMKLFTRLKNIKKTKKQAFLTLGHHHPDDDLVWKIFGFYFQHFSSFLSLRKLYGWLLVLLDLYLPKNDKI